MFKFLAGAVLCGCATVAFSAPIYTTTTYVGYDPNAATSNFGSPGNVNNETAYTVRTGIDSQFFYVDVTATPTAGVTPDQFANLYLGGPTISNGLLIEVTNDRATVTGSGNPYTDLAGSGFTYSASLNDISAAIPLTFLENDPLGIGFTKYNAGDLIRVSGSQSFGYSYDGGSVLYDRVNRLGAQIIPAANATGAVPEPASWAMMVGGFGLVGGALRRKKANVSFA